MSLRIEHPRDDIPHLLGEVLPLVHNHCVVVQRTLLKVLAEKVRKHFRVQQRIVAVFFILLFGNLHQLHAVFKECPDRDGAGVSFDLFAYLLGQQLIEAEQQDSSAFFRHHLCLPDGKDGLAGPRAALDKQPRKGLQGVQNCGLLFGKLHELLCVVKYSFQKPLLVFELWRENVQNLLPVDMPANVVRERTVVNQAVGDAFDVGEVVSRDDEPLRFRRPDGRILVA